MKSEQATEMDIQRFQWLVHHPLAQVAQQGPRVGLALLPIGKDSVSVSLSHANA